MSNINKAHISLAQISTEFPAQILCEIPRPLDTGPSLQGCGIDVAGAGEREKWEERLAEANRKHEAQTIFGVIFVGAVAAALVWGGLAYLLRDLIPFIKL